MSISRDESGRFVFEASDTNSLLAVMPTIVEVWHPDNVRGPSEFSPQSRESFTFLCPHGHCYEVQVRSVFRTYQKYKIWRCRKCPKITAGERDLLITYPGIIDIWSDENLYPPSYFSPKSSYKFIFQCERRKSHRYERMISNVTNTFDRTGGWGCSYCSGKKVSRKNRLTRHAYVVDQWHPDNEGDPRDYSQSSMVVKKWICDVGHVWETTIDNRVKSKGNCPTCIRQPRYWPDNYDEIVDSIAEYIEENENIPKSKDFQNLYGYIHSYVHEFDHRTWWDVLRDALKRIDVDITTRVIINEDIDEKELLAATKNKKRRLKCPECGIPV